MGFLPKIVVKNRRTNNQKRTMQVVPMANKNIMMVGIFNFFALFLLHFQCSIFDYVEIYFNKIYRIIHDIKIGILIN